MHRLHIFPLHLLGWVLYLAPAPIAAATFLVTRGDDPPPNGCLTEDCSLREALAATTTTVDADTVVLVAGFYNISRGTLAVAGAVRIEGAGSADTSIVGTLENANLLQVSPLSALELDGVRLQADDAAAIRAETGTITLHDVTTAPVGGSISVGSQFGNIVLRIESSQVRGIIECGGLSASCNVIDSTITGIVVGGVDADMELTRVTAIGVGVDYGVVFYSGGSAIINDSSIRNQLNPLYLLQHPGASSSEDVHISRTRFINNYGPLRGDRDGMVFLDEVEFRDNVVDAAHLADPAVLLAQPGTSWRVSRSLFIGNRGGGVLDGAVVRVLGGANVVMNNVTFDDNGFHPDIASGFGDTIGVYANSVETTVFWLSHATMKATATPMQPLGSLLSVRGATANVRVYNSLIQGSCGFGAAGALFHAIGNIESPGTSCGLDTSSNRVAVPTFQLRIGTRGDHGGFTETYKPATLSPLTDTADQGYCLFVTTDQRAYPRPAQGIDCDVGAVETNALLIDPVFADHFE
jgi:hypothetical protein